MHSTGADCRGLSRRPSPLTSREPTGQLQVRWSEATELDPWQGGGKEGSEIFLDALFEDGVPGEARAESFPTFDVILLS